jgi:tetratricopeptide (TPR) repeat protein
MSVTRLAVMPFTVRGSPEVDYLADGMVTLLSARLDGIGGLAAVDPRALLAQVAGEAALGEASPEIGQRVARHFGAGHYVLGDIVTAGGTVEISAALYESERIEPVSRARVSGSPQEIIGMVDVLAAELLTSRFAQARSRTVDLGGLTTVDLEALKDYLEGERMMRDGRFSEAVRALQGAVARDSTFALAQYLLGVAANWDDNEEVSRRATMAAIRERARLSPRAAALVDALEPYVFGRPWEAELQYRDIVRRYPDQLEAWYMLGEAIFHGGYATGKSLVESRDMFQRALALDPDNSEALLHLVRIAARHGPRVEFDQLVGRFLAANRTLEVQSLRAFMDRDPTSRTQVLEELKRASDVIVALSAIALAVFSEDMDGAREVTRILLNRPEGSYGPWARFMLIHLALAQGQFHEASSVLDDLTTDADARHGVSLLVSWVAATG